MKIYLALGLLSSLLLTSCWVDWNDAKEKRIGELEKQVTEMKKEKGDDLFKKKQECARLADELTKKTKNLWEEFSSLWKFSFVQVFYSPVKNKCLWIRNTENEFENWWAIYHNSLYEYWNDSWSSKSLDWCTKSIMIPEWTNNCYEFDERINKLKWE